MGGGGGEGGIGWEIVWMELLFSVSVWNNFQSGRDYEVIRDEVCTYQG